MRPIATGIAVVLMLSLADAPAAPTAADETYVGHGLAMHGKPKYGPDFTHFDYVEPDSSKGGSVKFAAIGTFDSLNPFILKGVSAVNLGLTYDSLLESSADEAFTMYGLIAETIEVPKDRSWVVFTLRPEARFHDATPVTVEDVIFTFNLVREKGTPGFRFYYASVEKVEKVDERKVKFTFEPGENRELPLIIGQLQILPKHYWESRDFTKTTLEPPLGSGPYRVESVDPGRSITYRRVEDYWARDLAVNVGRNNFDVIRYDYYRDSTVALEAFKAGEFDLRAENVSKNWATAYDVPAVRDGLIVKAEIPHRRTAGMQGFVFNTRKPMFRDRRVRRALAYAFDFEWTNKTLFYGAYTRTKSYFDNSELGARGLPGAEELEILERFRGRVPEEVFTTEFRPPETDGLGNIRPNLRQALRLLNEAGWTIEDQMLVNTETGRPMAFEILLDSPSWERVTLPFARNLERLGIVASVRLVDTAQYQKRTEDFDYDMIVAVFGQSLSPGNEQRNYWTSRSAELPGSDNSAGVEDPVVDELVELLIAAPDRESLIARTRALDRVLLWGHYVIPHWHIPFDRIAYWDRFGRSPVVPLQGAQIFTWWVDPQKEPELARRKQRMAELQTPDLEAKAGASAPTGSGEDRPGATRSGTGAWLALGGGVALALIVAGVIVRRRRSGAP